MLRTAYRLSTPVLRSVKVDRTSSPIVCKAHQRLATMGSAATSDTIVLYDSGTCPYAQRAWLALVEKQLPFEHRIVSLSDKPADFTSLYAEINPDPEARAKVPIIIDTDGTKMIESLIVAEYLDDKYPGQGARLLPDSAADRAKVRLFIEAYSSSIGSLTYGILRAETEEAVQEQVAKLERGLQVLDKFLRIHGSENGGSFLLGSQYSLAELATTPFLRRLVKVVPQLREQVDTLALLDQHGLTRLKAWVEATLARPSNLSTGGSDAELAESMKKFLAPLKVAA